MENKKKARTPQTDSWQQEALMGSFPRCQPSGNRVTICTALSVALLTPDSTGFNMDILDPSECKLGPPSASVDGDVSPQGLPYEEHHEETLLEYNALDPSQNQNLQLMSSGSGSGGGGEGCLLRMGYGYPREKQ